MTRASKGMNLLIIIGVVATSAIFAVSGYEFQSEKLSREFLDKVSNPSEDPPIETQNQYYEGIFRARLDHFRPQNQQRVNFVRLTISEMIKAHNFWFKNRPIV